MNKQDAGWHNRQRQRAHNMRNRHESGRAIGYATKAELDAILDAQGGRCAYCPATDDLTLDHKIPESRSGTNWPDNLQWLCFTHNEAKGSMTDAEYRGDHDDFDDLMADPAEASAGSKRRAYIAMVSRPKTAVGRPRNLNRIAAAVAGETQYQGAPCKRGHDGTRFTSTAACVECIRDKTRARAAKRRAVAKEGVVA